MELQLIHKDGEMKKTLLYLLLAMPIFLGVRCSCDDPVSSVNDSSGSVHTKVFIDRIGSLAKTQAISLTKAYLELSAVGEATLKDSFNLLGYSQQTVDQIFSDIKVKTWKAKAWTIDQNGNVIHFDSTTFAVVENDTIDVNLNLSARYSMLEVKFFPISDSATSASVVVNGVVVADSVFGKNATFDTLRLFFDYLPASLSPGTSATIRLDVRGDWVDLDTLLWTGQKVINVISGVDVNDAINLAWVGPQVGGMDMTVIIGRVAAVVVNGVVQPRPNTTP
jgi:hypothetical protein